MTTSAAPGAATMRLYLQRTDDRPGGPDARDEEECFTSAGRRIGVWLTTEVPRGPSTFEADVDPSDVASFEVTGSDAAHRSFVVPGNVVAALGFRAR